jgi:hypothetical protein
LNPTIRELMVETLKNKVGAIAVHEHSNKSTYSKCPRYKDIEFQMTYVRKGFDSGKVFFLFTKPLPNIRNLTRESRDMIDNVINDFMEKTEAAGNHIVYIISRDKGVFN